MLLQRQVVCVLFLTVVITLAATFATATFTITPIHSPSGIANQNQRVTVGFNIHTDKWSDFALQSALFEITIPTQCTFKKTPAATTMGIPITMTVAANIPNGSSSVDYYSSHIPITYDQASDVLLPVNKDSSKPDNTWFHAKPELFTPIRKNDFRTYLDIMVMYTIDFASLRSKGIELECTPGLKGTEFLPQFHVKFQLNDNSGFLLAMASDTVLTTRSIGNTYLGIHPYEEVHQNMFFNDTEHVARAHIVFDTYYDPKTITSTFLLPSISPELISSLTDSSEIYLLLPEYTPVTDVIDTLFSDTTCTLHYGHTSSSHSAIKLHQRSLYNRSALKFTVSELMPLNDPSFNLQYGVVLTCTHTVQGNSSNRQKWLALRSNVENRFTAIHILFVPNPAKCPLTDTTMTDETFQNCVYTSDPLRFATTTPYSNYGSNEAIFNTQQSNVTRSKLPYVTATRFYYNETDVSSLYSRFNVHIPLVDPQVNQKFIAPQNIAKNAWAFLFSAPDTMHFIDGTYKIQCSPESVPSDGEFTKYQTFYPLAYGALGANHTETWQNPTIIGYNNTIQSTSTTAVFPLKQTNIQDPFANIDPEWSAHFTTLCRSTLVSLNVTFKTSRTFSPAAISHLPNPMINVLVGNTRSFDEVLMYSRAHILVPFYPKVFSSASLIPQPDPTPTPTPHPDPSGPVDLPVVVDTQFNHQYGIVSEVALIFNTNTMISPSSPLHLTLHISPRYKFLPHTNNNGDNNGFINGFVRYGNTSTQFKAKLTNSNTLQLSISIPPHKDRVVISFSNMIVVKKLASVNDDLNGDDTPPIMTIYAPLMNNLEYAQFVKTPVATTDFDDGTGPIKPDHTKNDSNGSLIIFCFILLIALVILSGYALFLGLQVKKARKPQQSDESLIINPADTSSIPN